MRSGPQPLAAQDRLVRVGDRADHVGGAHRIFDRRRPRSGNLRGQPLRLRLVAARDEDLLELPRPRQVARVRERLHAGAHDGEHLRVVARQEPRRQRRGRGRPLRGDGSAVEQQEERSVARIEERDDGLVRGPVAVLGKDRHQLGRERVERLHVRRHRGEQPGFREGRHARRERDAARAHLDERRGHRLDERIGFEQRLHFRAAEKGNAHGTSRSLPVVLREASSSCALAASERGKTCSICNFSSPRFTAPSTAAARPSSSSRVER